jgi:2-polyprenyl-3-methyl-5-hydroxy-6-metoxy-1,4-benzoquinol methylase
MRPIRRVALIFDNESRPETTGVYCRRALGQLVEVEHFLPSELSRIPRDGFDLYLHIDDGIRYRLPADLRPSAWWVIDTHMDFAWDLEKARDFDFVFVAQKDGAAQLRAGGIASAQWLPLACDPEIHRPHPVEKTFDVGFVGNLCVGPRTELLERILKEYPQSFVGHAYFEEMARVYSASKIAFNRSVRNDVNMRVFEALACGTLLLTNDLAENGQAELFQDGVHLATYHDADELFEKLWYFLQHEQERDRIARAGREAVVGAHTYLHRMQTILNVVAARPIRSKVDLHRTPLDAIKDRTYYEFARPEVLALIPTPARSVLEIGCGAGRLGAALKQRQGAQVVGVELDPEAAALASQRLDLVITGDIEQERLGFADGRFDCVVCADVLEHLRQPQELLARIRRWLTADGRLIISLPNVQHHSVVQGLIEGNWTYEAAGLLDRTHLRFFTRQTIEALLRDSGFEIERIDAVRLPQDEEQLTAARGQALPLGRLTVSGLSADNLEQFFVYQYLAMAKPAVRIPRHTSRNARGGLVRDSGIGCILAIRNRPAHYLERTFQTFAFQTVRPADQVLLDYGSDAEFAVQYRQLCSKFGWRYLHVLPEEPHWSLAAAYNRAAAALNSEVRIVFKSDVDVLLGENVLALAAKHGASRFCQFPYFTTRSDAVYPDRFASPKDLAEFRKQCPGKRPSAGQGLFACPLWWFRKVGGFDLNFRSWGYEDHDLRERAERSLGAIDLDFRAVTLVHQWHPASAEAGDARENEAYFFQMRHSGEIVRNSGWLVPEADSSCPSPDSADASRLSPDSQTRRASGTRTKNSRGSTLVRIVRNYSEPDLMRQTPGGMGIWAGIKFTEEPVETCDYLVVLNEPAGGERLPGCSGPIWRIAQEPPAKPFHMYHEERSNEGIVYDRVYTQDELQRGDRFRYAPGMLPWHVRRDYDTLVRLAPPTKTRDLSWITSNKCWLPGHRDRMRFLDAIRDKLPFDLFGRGFQPLDDKWEGLAPYRYSLAIENSAGAYYWSEKIVDCFLAWTVPIYFGCSRITEYFPAEAVVQIDIHDPLATVEQIRELVEGNGYESRLEALAAARELALNKHQLFPFLAEQIALEESGNRAARPLPELTPAV